MKRIATLLSIAVFGVALACDDQRDPGPAAPQVQPAAEDLVDLLPGSTLAAVELLDLDRRWDELRAIPPLARLQDHVLDLLGVDADAVPAIAGARMVLAFVADDASRRIVPVVLLDPPSRADALRRLAASEALVVAEARGVLWAGPATHAPLVERTAAGDGTSLRRTIDFPALARWLPPGGLVRAVLNPGALGEWLRRWAVYAGTNPAAPLARLLAADLEAIEVAGFRRDVVHGELVTEVWVGIDTDVVPKALARALATHRGPAVLPPHLPADVVIAESFRTEPEAGLAWLRALAARDPEGPLRQFDFWVDEFEARSGRSVDSDIIDALGERGILLLIESDDGGALELVVILDAEDPDRLEAALIGLRDWLAEQVSGRSLGLAWPRRHDTASEDGVTHGLDFWSPLGTLSGPVFQIVDGRLVVATNRGALDRGAELARTAATWTTPGWALAGGLPDEIAWIRIGALARSFVARSAHSLAGDPLLPAVLQFLAGTGEGRLRVYYEEQGFRMVEELRLDSGARM